MRLAYQDADKNRVMYRSYSPVPTFVWEGLTRMLLPVIIAVKKKTQKAPDQSGCGAADEAGPWHRHGADPIQQAPVRYPGSGCGHHHGLQCTVPFPALFSSRGLGAGGSQWKIRRSVSGDHPHYRRKSIRFKKAAAGYLAPPGTAGFPMPIY